MGKSPLRLVKNVFSYDELGFVPAYAHIGTWVRRLLSIDKDFRGAVGIAVPIDLGQEGEFAVEFVEWATNTSDASATTYEEKCHAGSLFFPRKTTALGTLISLLSGSGVERGNVGTLLECANAWLTTPTSVTFHSFHNPTALFGDHYKSSFEAAGQYMIVYPIISDDGRSLLGMFGFDVLEAPKDWSPTDQEDPMTRALNEELQSLKHILEQFLWSYYTYLDSPEDPPGWQWGHEGRVFSPTYLFKLKEAMKNGGAFGLGVNARDRRLSWLRSEKLIFAYADADGIKKLNDAYGHEVGNLVIRGVGAALWLALPEENMVIGDRCDALNELTVRRKQGVIVRWGGDEYLAILPVKEGDEGDEPIELVRVFLQRLEKRLGECLQAIETHKLGTPGISESVGLSVGWGVVSRRELKGRYLWPPAVEHTMYECKAASRLLKESVRRSRYLRTVEGPDQGRDMERESRGVKVAALEVECAKRLAETIEENLRTWWCDNGGDSKQGGSS